MNSAETAFPLLACRHLRLESFFVQGFTGKGSLDELFRFLGVSSAVFLRQVHGRAVLDLDNFSLNDLLVADPSLAVLEADALVCSVRRDRPFAAIIRTADCVPIILNTGCERVALVHAGWRGLACGVIEAAVEALGAGVQEAFIGPCACGRCYEVGHEVVEAIGETCCIQSSASLLLDLPRTAAAQLRRVAPGVKVYDSGICTIENADFHSYRREGAGAGRNFAYLAVRAN